MVKLGENSKIAIAAIVVFTFVTLLTLTAMSAAELPPQEITDTTEKTVTEIKSDTEVIKDYSEKIYDVVGLPSVKVWGTEYIPGDNMTIWLQLLDEDRLPITNATCFDKIWYPDKTVFHGYTSMIYLDEGIFYDDRVAPNQTGVYPISAMCYIPSTGEYITSYKYDDGSADSEQIIQTDNIYAHEFNWTNPTADYIEMCAWIRDPNDRTFYWTVGLNSIQLMIGENSTAGWVCNQITNLSWFNFTGNEYFGINCSDCAPGNRAYLGQDIDGAAPPNSQFYDGSWKTSNDIYFIRINVTDITQINVTQYVMVMSSGEIHVNYPWAQSVYIWLTTTLSTWMNSTTILLNNTHNAILNNTNYITNQIHNSTAYLANLITGGFIGVSSDMEFLRNYFICGPFNILSRGGTAQWGTAYYNGTTIPCQQWWLSVREPPEVLNVSRRTIIDATNACLEYFNQTSTLDANQTNVYTQGLNDFLSQGDPLAAHGGLGIIRGAAHWGYTMGFCFYQYLTLLW